MTARIPLWVALVLVGLAGCQPEPRAIRYGEDVGAHCKMTVSDARFGSQLLTTTGKVYVFDAVECLANYVLAHDELADQTHSLWVTAYDAPGELIPLDSAFFIHSPDVQSPMGGGLAAFGPSTPPEEAQRQLGGEVLTWADVLELANQPVQRGADRSQAASSTHASDTAMNHPAGLSSPADVRQLVAPRGAGASGQWQNRSASTFATGPHSLPVKHAPIRTLQTFFPGLT